MPNFRLKLNSNNSPKNEARIGEYVTVAGSTRPAPAVGIVALMREAMVTLPNG